MRQWMFGLTVVQRGEGNDNQQADSDASFQCAPMGAYDAARQWQHVWSSVAMEPAILLQHGNIFLDSVAVLLCIRLTARPMCINSTGGVVAADMCCILGEILCLQSKNNVHKWAL
eukprot:jgi/Ulvmu1/10835/UM007_0009.1